MLQQTGTFSLRLEYIPHASAANRRSRTGKTARPMSHPTEKSPGRHTRFHAGFAFILWLVGMPSLQAQTRPASDPILTIRLERTLEMIPGSPTDLPAYLARSQDVYLLVTAGAAYTEIQVLANPAVPPQTVARALASALAKTPLRGQTVEWSADHYSAAQVSRHHGHIGAVQGTNTVPVAALLTGLREAGLTPHLLLRLAAHTRAGALPWSDYGSRTFRWYDARRLGSRSSVTVTTRMTWVSLARVLAYFLLLPVIGTLGLMLAHVLSRRNRRGLAAQRQVFHSVSTSAIMISVAAQIGAMIYLLRTPTPAAIADLWFGSSTTSPLVPFLAAGIAAMPLFLVLARRQETRRFGPVPAPAEIPMPEEERAARKRVAQYSALPHMIFPVLLVASPFIVSRHSPLYAFIHPLSVVLTAVGGGLIARIFRKRLDKFTQKTADHDLTWRARQLGQSMNVRMPNVLVEDSSRAEHLAFAMRQGHDITLSRKLLTTFAPAETDFVLAHHLACMRRGRRGGNQWLRGLSLILPALLLLLVAAPLGFPGAPSLSSLLHSPWFSPAFIAYFIVMLGLTLRQSKTGARQMVAQEADADRTALEVTRDFQAAESAISKLTPEGLLSPSSTVRSGTANRELLQTMRTTLRQKSLLQAAQALDLAPRTLPDSTHAPT